MSYHVNDNTIRIEREHNNKVPVALRLMLEEIHRKSTPITPMRTGQLRGDVNKTVTNKTGKIVWGKNYAWYQERGYTSGTVRRYTTAGTGAHFAEKSVHDVAKDGKKYFKVVGLL